MPLSIELDSKLIKLTQKICLRRQTLQKSMDQKHLIFFAAKDKKKEKERNKEKREKRGKKGEKRGKREKKRREEEICFKNSS